MEEQYEEFFLDYFDELLYKSSSTRDDAYDILGIPFPKRSKLTHPYNYDTYIIWCNGKKPTSSVYTDRLFQWDYNKYNALCTKHFGDEGQYWSDRNIEKIQSFLRDYIDNQDIEVVGLAETCNQATGFPIGIIFYK